MVHDETKHLDHLGDKIRLHSCSITDKDGVNDIICKAKPDYIFHLAAQSLLTNSWLYPEQTIIINTLGTINLLEAVKANGLGSVTEIICSSDEYASQNTSDAPITESASFGPSSPYGVSKLAADMMGYIYWQKYNMKIIRVRPFSIIGPRKTSDACSDFARGIVEIETGKKVKVWCG